MTSAAAVRIWYLLGPLISSVTVPTPPQSLVDGAFGERSPAGASVDTPGRGVESALRTKQHLSEMSGVEFRVADPRTGLPGVRTSDSMHLDGAALGAGHFDRVPRVRRVLDEFVASRALFVEEDPVVSVVPEDDVVPFVRED